MANITLASRRAKIKVRYGFYIISEVKHLGLGGNIWVTEIIDPVLGSSRAKFEDDSYTISVRQAIRWIDDIVSVV